MTMTIELYDDLDREIKVELEITPGMKGSKDSWGCPMEPDDPDTIEILSAIREDGEEIELTADQEETARLAAEDQIADGWFDDWRY